MSLFRFALLVSLLAAKQAASAEPTKLIYSLGGSTVGENSFDRKPDGAFESRTTLEILGTKVSSVLTGKIEKGKLTSYDLTQTAGPQTMHVWTEGGKVHGKVGGQERQSPFTISTGLVFSNYHPQLMNTFFSLVDPKVEWAQKVTVFVPDSGGETSLAVTARPGRQIERAGKPVAVRTLMVKVGLVDIELSADDTGAILGQNVPSQKFKAVRVGFDGLYADPIAKYPELSQATLPVKHIAGASIAMRDGVNLIADIAMPAQEGKYPAILVRTPYGRTTSMIDADFWASRGYVYISQDCRGRHDSGGEWDPFIFERKDGFDSIEWIARQPWSDGKVGMIGGSYGGYVQWAAAVEHPAALKCIVPQVSPPDAFHNLPYDHGTFMLMGGLWWSRIVKDKVSNMAGAAQPLPHPDKLLTLPLSKVDDEVLGENIPFFDRWLERDNMSKWSGFDTLANLASVQIPALHISGWWDGDGIGTKLNWQTMRAAKHDNQWLIYGPWTHAFNSSTKFGDNDYGPGAVLELDSLYVRWFDTWLKGKSVGLEKTPKVRVFVTGANEWRDLSDWPDRSMPEKSLYLAPDGVLADKPVEGAKPATYTYDPASLKLPAGVNESAMNEGSTVVSLPTGEFDGLVYRTAPLDAPLTIAGSIAVHLSFSTDVKATDFFVTLLDIDERGVARYVGLPGKINTMYRDSLVQPTTLEPGKPYKVTIDLWDTARQFAKGHRVAILVKSDSFPGYARNLNTGEPILSATRMVAAHQTIFQDSARPSVLRFRVLPPARS